MSRCYFSPNMLSHTERRSWPRGSMLECTTPSAGSRKDRPLLPSRRVALSVTRYRQRLTRPPGKVRKPRKRSDSFDLATKDGVPRGMGWGGNAGKASSSARAFGPNIGRSSVCNHEVNGDSFGHARYCFAARTAADLLHLRISTIEY